MFLKSAPNTTKRIILDTPGWHLVNHEIADDSGSTKNLLFNVDGAEVFSNKLDSSSFSTSVRFDGTNCGLIWRSRENSSLVGQQSVFGQNTWAVGTTQLDKQRYTVINIQYTVRD